MPDYASALTPTPAQIEQFKRLSPAEQKALAQSMGVDLSAASSAGSSAPASNPQTVAPRAPNITKSVETHVSDTVTGKTPATFLESNTAVGVEEKVDAKTQRVSLKPFGYELFAGSPSTFAPATDIPVPTDYAIGPGDTIIVQLYGKENATHELAVSREGKIQFPEIGPISINGLNFSELRERIDQLVGEQMIGVKASVTMGSLRSIKVFVLGEAFRPGAYTISALSTMTHALFASGGIKDIGSLRNIQLKRKGKVIATLDLYDLLLAGDTSADQRLHPGDVVFVPTLQKTAAVTGEVRRPAIYELKGATTAADLIRLAGDYHPTAYPKASRIEHIDRQGHRTVADVDLTQNTGKQKSISNGDVLKVYSVLDKLERVVVVSGHVHRPGFYSWKQGLRVKDVVGSVSDLKSNPDLNIALIKHETGPERLLSFEVFDLSKALAGDRNANRLLKPRDEIIIFGAGDENRANELADFIAVLNQQAPTMHYPMTVTVHGDVKAPGVYPLAQFSGKQAISVQSLVAMAGGLKPTAQKTLAVLADRTDRAGRYHIRTVPLASTQQTAALQPGSELYVLSNINDRQELLDPLTQNIRSQSWHGERLPLVTIGGAVRFPGEYPFMAGSTVKDVITLAGGLREEAYLLSGEVTRTDVMVGSEFEVTHQAVTLTEAGPTGMGFPLQARDALIIKQIPEWEEIVTVSVQGEVNFPGDYPVRRGETLGSVIARAGGLTEHADAKGAVFLRESLKEKEAEALAKFKAQLEKEAMAAEVDGSGEADLVSKEKAARARMLAEVNDAKAMGRLVIDLSGILADRADVQDVVLRAGDQIVVPQLIQEVSIVGEVNYPTSHLYQRGVGATKYLKKSGGLTRNGDIKRTYVIGRDGDVRPLHKWRFFFLSMKNPVKPGDTVVVPVDVDKVSPMTYWVQVSQILFQLATTAAALDTVGAL